MSAFFTLLLPVMSQNLTDYAARRAEKQLAKSPPRS